MRELLLLRAEDGDDLKILSACVQDMAATAGDVVWEPKHRRLVILGNRFRWETAIADKSPPTRVRSALRFDHVDAVQRRGWPPLSEIMLSLLSVREESDEEGRFILIDFSGFSSLRLKAESIDVTLEDITGPWGARSRPRHEDN